MGNSFEPGTNVAEPSTRLYTQEEDEPLVPASARQVVEKSLSFAEEFALTLKELLNVKRDILFNY